MQIRLSLIIVAGLICFQSQGQIILDEQLGDWEAIPVLHEDPIDAPFGLELLDLKMSNDEEYVYFLLKVGQEINLQDNNNLQLYIDTDDNPNTGFAINGIGADLRYFPGQRFGFLNVDGNSTEIEHEESGWVHAPTVTGNIFEFCLNRNIQRGSRQIEFGNQVKLFFRNGTSGDLLPNNGNLSYQLDNTIRQATPTYSISKINTSNLRVMSYNVLRDNIFNNNTQNSFRNIFRAIRPDIICFQEIYDHSAEEVADLLNAWIPLDNQSWFFAKQGPDIITISRYPIVEDQNVGTNGAFKIRTDDGDLLMINAHLPCCDNEEGRQFEVDQILDFIRDSKNGNATVNIQENTPIVICGDMNFVGEAQQVISLQDGNIINEDIFGEDIVPDWNGNNLIDAKPTTTGTPLSFTWFRPSSSFSAGRLDYVIFTSSVLKKRNAFNLYTPELSFDQLDRNRLNQEDTDIASDHLPSIVDFEMGDFTSLENISAIPLNIWPNPGKDIFHFQIEAPNRQVNLKVFNALGELLFSKNGLTNKSIDLSPYSSGLYFISLDSGQKLYQARILKL